MKRRTPPFAKALSVVFVAALALALLPAASVSAAGPIDAPHPRRDAGNRLRLERIFAQQKRRYDHQTEFLARAPGLIQRIQDRIDQAAARGQDVSAVQAALDAFEAALPAAQTAHDGAGTLIAEHAGFDGDGRTTKVEAAVTTVRGIHDAFAEFRRNVLPPYRALRAALRAFMAENHLQGERAPGATATP